MNKVILNRRRTTEEAPVPDSPKWGTWGTILWGVLILFVYILVQALMVAGFAFKHALEEGDTSPDAIQAYTYTLEADGLLMSIATVLGLIVCIPLICGIVKLKKGSVLKAYLGLKQVPFFKALPWVATVCMVLLITDLSSILQGLPVTPEIMIELYESSTYPLLFWFAIVFAAPVAEEFIFRGFMLANVPKGRVALTVALVLTSTIWASLHFQYERIDAFIFIFVIGCVLGLVRIKTGSLILCIILHMLINLGAMIQIVWLLNKSFY